MPKDEELTKEEVRRKLSAAREGVDRTVDEAEDLLRSKGREIKEYLKDISAVLEEWKVSVEENAEGTRIEIRAVALIKTGKKGR